MATLYKVPVVYHEVRPCESYYQILGALETVNSTVCDLFGKISARVGEERARMEKISSRIRKSKETIQQIQGAPRATIVKSPCRYPSHAPQAPPVFVSDLGTCTTPSFKYTLSSRKHPHNRLAVGEEPAPPQLTLHTKEKEKIVEEVGLGLGTSNLTSVSSLVLFNSKKQVLKGYVKEDNLERSHKKKKKINKEETETLPPPMQWILNPPNMDFETKKSNYIPGPTSTDLVGFQDLPQNLPELQVADDIRYQLPNFESIAPCDVLSAADSKKISVRREPPSEPKVEGIKKNENPLPVPVSTKATEPARLPTPVVEPTVKSTIPKVSPPQLQLLPLPHETVSTTVSTQSEGISNEIPMPPVKNSNPVENKSSQVNAEKNIQDSRPRNPPRQGWSSLMDDIKNRAKALRPVIERKVEQNIPENPTLQEILKEKMKNIHDSQNGIRSPEKNTDSGDDESWDEEN